MGLIGQGFTTISTDLEDGYPKHLGVKHEIEFDGSADAVDWYVLWIDISPTTMLRLTADSLDQLTRLAEQLTHAVGERRRRDALAEIPTS